MADDSLHPLPESDKPELEAQSILALLARIERHLARVADAIESFTSDSCTFVKKDLGPTREMPNPKRRAVSDADSFAGGLSAD
jgi:hypothetical protein